MIWPAIDLMDGQCVRLHQGDFQQRTNYNSDPLACAKQFAAAGATSLHIVDLDGAKAGSLRQQELITNIATNTDLVVQAGGGVRKTKDIGCLLDGGVSRVIIGSLAVTAPETVLAWLEQFGSQQIVLAIDVRLENNLPIPAIRGWQDKATTDLWQVLDYYGDKASNLLVTDIDRDGVLGGANAGLYSLIKSKYPKINLLASGGIGNISDIRAVKRVGTQGVIIGKALYEKNFSLEEALSCWREE
ncbi:MAG: 1-(5-phosphoribosyl)-5-[(5-phosphoribosylamino)methylideneamino]imidazole-4-carboxamide isomerase [Robiginitomaculum sp.]|nr:1-(5-phosphoribosyl)-5-[(5-phosphoribosylamino)methylideneamino]imidazole-4-carboxamide isomerase [Robiginitomaculum sp.]